MPVLLLVLEFNTVVVCRDDEAAVAREFAGVAPALGYECQWFDARGVRSGMTLSFGLAERTISEMNL